MKFSQFERKQCLQSLKDPGAVKTVRDMDFIKALMPLVDAVLNLPMISMMWSDIEAKKYRRGKDRRTGQPIMSWGLFLVGQLELPIADFGDDPASEHNAQMVATLLNAAKEFRMKVI